MKIYLLLSFFITIYLCNGYDCTGQSNVLGIKENRKTGINIISANDCKDRKLCYLSCKDIYKKEKCSAKKIGFEIGKFKKKPLLQAAYNRACRRGRSGDKMYEYLKTIQFNGKAMYHSSDKFLSKGFRLLRGYLKRIRDYDWCKNDGLYKKRQDEHLKDYENTNKRYIKRNKKMASHNLDLL
jgi:hypothetical protein